MAALDGFKIIAKLGDGSYSSVYKVLRKEDNVEYALKKVKIQNLSDREKENALNEVRILASIKNPFVAGYKEAFFDENSSSLCIVMEYADDGDVFQRICTCQNNKQFMKEKHIWKIVIQVVRGLQALHELKILHRDMKSANIFLYKNQDAKLGDLNVSKVAKKGLLYTQTGTPYYASPEVWKDQPYDLKSDIWSLGCVIYEMCALVPPFRAEDMNGLFKRVLKGQYPPIPSHYSMDMRQLIKTLLQVEASNRPDCTGILNMSIITKRIKKYFQDKSEVKQALEDDVECFHDSELLRTIKLSKNLFKMKLPKSTYEPNFQTIPGQAVIRNGGARTTGAGNSLPKMTASSNESSHRNQLPRIAKKPSKVELGTEQEPNKPQRDERSVEGPNTSGRRLSNETKVTSHKKSIKGNNTRSVAQDTPSTNKGKSDLAQASDRADQEIEVHERPQKKDKKLSSQLSGSPSIQSMEQQQPPTNNIRSSKNQRKILAVPINEYDEYSDEVSKITHVETGSVQKKKRSISNLNEQQELMVQKLEKEKRIPRVPESQSALENHLPQSRLKGSSLSGSPSALSLQKIEQPGVPTNSKSRIRLGVNYGNHVAQNGPTLQNSASTSVLPQANGGYKRIVNIYSLNEAGAPRQNNGSGLNSYKKQRRSQAPDQRLYLNHSLVQPQGLPLKSESRKDQYARSPSIENLQLPELKNVHRNQQQHQHHQGIRASNSYSRQQQYYEENHPVQSRPYHYKSTLENQNSAMISKLLSRKRSYERMMQVSDVSNLSRANNNLSTLASMNAGNNNISASGIPIHNSNIGSRKNQEILLSVGGKKSPENISSQPYGVIHPPSRSIKQGRSPPHHGHYLDNTPTNQLGKPLPRGNRVIPVQEPGRLDVTGNRLGSQSEKKNLISSNRLRVGQNSVQNIEL